MINAYTTRYREKSTGKIPTGLNYFGEACQNDFMEDDLEKQAQEIYDRILERIRDALKEKRSIITETELGFRCGLSQPTINRIKSGARGKDLPLMSVLKLALILNIDLTTLYLSTGPAQSKLKTLLSEISKMIVND